MTRLATLLLGMMLVGCENPVAPPPTDARELGVIAGTELAGCVKYRLWPDQVEIAGQFDRCMDGAPSEVVAMQWESTTPGVCPITPDGSGIKGGLRAVRYLYGCPKRRQVAPKPLTCADCGWEK